MTDDDDVIPDWTCANCGADLLDVGVGERVRETVIYDIDYDPREGVFRSTERDGSRDTIASDDYTCTRCDHPVTHEQSEDIVMMLE